MRQNQLDSFTNFKAKFKLSTRWDRISIISFLDWEKLIVYMPKNIRKNDTFIFLFF